MSESTGMGGTRPPRATRVAVFGLGYVGCVTAACLARLGHDVTGIDKDAYKVEAIGAGRAPFFEPGLDDEVRLAVESGRLRATTAPDEAVRTAEVVLLCVGTPSERNGDLGLDQLRRVVRGIAEHVPSRGGAPLIVAVRSTVFPGTCDAVVAAAFRDHPEVRIVSNPEFLRSGSAVSDFLRPALVVAGGPAEAAARVAELYAPLGGEAHVVSMRDAEMIKYACNAFHALKIAFANEIGAVCAEAGADAASVMEILCRDTRLNLSAAYLRPGLAFGGSCLPKDLRALVHRAARLDLDLPLLESVLPSNEAHLQRAIDGVLGSGARRIGILGLAYKENTDDLRESPVIRMAEALIGKGFELRIFDPHVTLEAIHGTNRDYLLHAIPHIARLLAPGIESVTEWADCLVVTQKPSPSARERIAAAGVPVHDVAGLLRERPLYRDSDVV